MDKKQKHRISALKTYHKYSDKYKKKYNERRKQLRIDVINGYGGKCNCCGITNILFLTIDHVKCDGNIERKTVSHNKLFYRLRKEKFKDKNYQVLCFNCNCGKSLNKGTCPHERE